MRRRPEILAGLFLALGLAPAAQAVDAASPFGINVHAPQGDHLRFLLDRVAEAGIGWIRIDFVWAVVEPEPGVERWELYDAIVAEARARRLEVLALIAYTPAWATDGPAISGAPRDPADWSGFCFRAANRYRDAITHWEIWNEPNLERFWAGDRAAYLETILEPAARAIHAANPDARVGGPALAHLESGGRAWHGWLLDVLRAAGEELDFVTHHVYDLEDPAGVLRRLGGETPYGGDPSRWSEAAPSLRELLEVALFDKPVWLTETGWPTTRLDESLQAVHYRGFLDLWLGGDAAPGGPERVFFYELQDDREPSVPDFGLLRISGRPKPAFGALREFVAGWTPRAVPAEEPAERPGRDERGPRTVPPV
jgi:hypothetical protein